MSKVDDAITILRTLGLPKAQQNERSALTLLALANLTESLPWSEAGNRSIRIHDILIFIQENYEKQYAENTRETIRRQTIHQFEQAGVTIKNPDNPRRPTNSPKTAYAITNEALEVIRKYDTGHWQFSLQRFVENRGKLIERYEKRREANLISVDLPDGTHMKFSGFFNTVKYGGEDNLTLFSRQTPPVSGKNAEKHL